MEFKTGNPLLSRKFLFSIASALAILFAQMFGWDVDPEAIVAFGAIVIAYVSGQTVLDRKAISVNGEFATRLAQAQAATFYQQILAESEAEGSGGGGVQVSE